MTIFSVFIVNRAGGLIYDYDHSPPKAEIEKTFSFPLEPVLKLLDKRVVVSFGQRDGIKVGYTLLAVNGELLNGKEMKGGDKEGRDVFTFLAEEENYPVSLRFGRPKLSTNEKIMLASMFHSLFAIGCQLSPEPKSSGIEVLEADSFKLYCTQTLTGIKFIAMADPKQAGMEALLRKLYEVYSDYALKNPFYSVDMPIRCDLFDQNLQVSIEQAERFGVGAV